jgi:hypothetical protein
MVRGIQKQEKKERKSRCSMASKNKNPYRDGTAYNKLFDYIRSKQIVTVDELSKAGFKSADISVILSPAKEGVGRGDPRGNLSAQGHLYFMDRMTKKNKGEAQRFRLRWREVPLDKRSRYVKKEIEKEIESQTSSVPVEDAALVD